MRRRCVTTPQNPKDNLLVASFIFPSHQNVQDEPFSRKSHVICFWDRKGFFLVDFMPKNAEAYCNTLKKTQKSHSEPQKGNADPGRAADIVWMGYCHPPPLFTRLGAFGLSLFH
ncbi:hypothetical protein MTP99_014700 [Tenebrio molitor]|nr:hypothetical protein MTP99_014700 [Tenebrio molitor]